MQGGLTALQAPAPVTGPRDSLTAVWLLAIRYPARGASTTLAVPDPDVAPGTGCQAPVPATADVSWYEEQPVEPPSEVDRGSPEQRAKTANARSPTASRLMTCSPPVWTCCHVCPPSRVHHNSGPKTLPRDDEAKASGNSRSAAQPSERRESPADERSPKQENL